MAENAPRVNPLASIMRQPKIYITLPSHGKYWPEGSLNTTINGEYPVYSMTAKDEIILKTPDALLNGQGIVDVIQSCMPNVLNAWDIPQIDLDVILVGIRIATYGETMNLSINHNTLTEEMDYELNLREIMDRLLSITSWDERLEIRPDLVIFLKPINYKTITNSQISDFDTGRLMNIVRDTELDEESKVAAFKKSFETLNKKTLDLITGAVYKIESSAGNTDDPEFIAEFIRNCDADIFDAIKKRLGILNDANTLPPLLINSTPEMMEKGAPAQIEVPFSFDQANFFG